MRHESDARGAAARLLAALAVLLPAAAAAGEVRGGTAVASAVTGAEEGASISLAGEAVAVGFRGRLEGATLRLLQGIDECTENTSVGDAEAGIAIYEDEEACSREEGPLVGCNGESSQASRCALRLLLCVSLYIRGVCVLGLAYKPSVALQSGFNYNNSGAGAALALHAFPDWIISRSYLLPWTCVV